MPYDFVAEGFHAKKLCSRLSSSEVRCYTENGRFAFLSPKGGLGATYNVHLKLIGERVVYFLLVLIELFCQVLRLRRYERTLTKNRRFHSNGGLTQIFR